ncbi:MAG: GumC family protein [Desulfuromonadales bacterium]
MTEPQAPRRRQTDLFTQEKEVHLSDYLNILLRRWKIALLVFALVFVGTALYTFLATPVFEAYATLQVRKPGQGSMLKELGMESESSLTTEIEVLQSRSLAEQVVRRMNLDWQIASVSPGFDVQIVEFSMNGTFAGLKIDTTGPAAYTVSDLTGRQLGTGESGRPFVHNGMRLLLNLRTAQPGQTLVVERQPVEELINGIQRSIRVVEMGKGSNMLRVTSQSSDPGRARDVVNLLIEAYLSTNVASRTREAGKTVDFIGEQLTGLKDNLDKSEQELQEYKVQTGLTTLGPEGGSLVGKVVGLEQQKSELNLKRQRVEYAIETLQQALKKGTPFTPPVIEGAPQVAESAAHLAELEAARKGMLVNFTPAHPAVLEKEAEIRRVQEAMLSAYQSLRQELSLGERDTAITIAGYDEQLKDIPETELELAKRTRVHKVNAELYNFLLQKQQEARIAQASTISSVDVIDPALTPKAPIKPNKKKNLALGLVLGLMLGVGLVFLLDYMDQTIKTSDDVRDKLGLTVLGIIPRIPFADEDARLPGRRLVTTLAPRSPVVESFRALRTNLNFLTDRESHKVILVTSSLPDEGKSTVSGNLAVILAQTGARVLLVGCDLRRPSLYTMFGQNVEPGLTNLLVEDNQAAVRKLANPKIDFLPAGKIPPNPAEILGSGRMKKFLAAARERYDYVVLDAPPVLPVTDSQVLAPLADLVLVVLEPCRIPERAARQMVESLNAVDSKISGVILNDKSGRGFKYYGSYNYYGNKYYRGYYGETGDDAPDAPAVAFAKRVWDKLNS